MRKETVVNQLSVLARHMPGGTEENHETAVVMVGTPSKLEIWTSMEAYNYSAPSGLDVLR